MNYTENYQLNQWESADRVLRTDFNEDNQTVDAAIKAAENYTGVVEALANQAKSAAAHAQAAADLAQATADGGVKIAVGSYTGSGAYGSAHPNSLTFTFKPLIIFMDIATIDDYNSIPQYYMFFYGVPSAYAKGTSSANILSWSENGVSWYTQSSSDSSGPQYQFNRKGQVYHYIAIG